MEYYTPFARMRSTTIVTFHTEKFLSFPKRKIMQKVLNARVVASAGSIFLLPKWSQFCDSATEDKRHNKTTGYKLYSCMPIRDLFVNSQHRNIATRLLRKKTHKSTYKICNEGTKGDIHLTIVWGKLANNSTDAVGAMLQHYQIRKSRKCKENHCKKTQVWPTIDEVPIGEDRIRFRQIL